MKEILFGITLGFAFAIALLILALRSMSANERKQKAAEDAHWQSQADAILAANPNADVSFCFRRNRPPRRNPSGPAPTPRIDTGD